MDKNTKTIPLSLFIIFLSLLSVTFLWKHNLFLTAILIVLSALLLLILQNKKNIKLYLIFAILGVITEALMVSRNAWVYPHPDIFKIPIWLPFLWGIVALFIRQITIIIDPQKTKWQILKTKVKKLFRK
jgi:uncharacterized membrane protein YoaT (DUF817 family)